MSWKTKDAMLFSRHLELPKRIPNGPEWIHALIHGFMELFSMLDVCRNKSKDIKKNQPIKIQKCPRWKSFNISRVGASEKSWQLFWLAYQNYQTSGTWWCEMNYSPNPNPSTHNFLNDVLFVPVGHPINPEPSWSHVFFLQPISYNVLFKLTLNTHHLEKKNQCKLTPKDVPLTSPIYLGFYRQPYNQQWTPWRLVLGPLSLKKS